MRITVPDYYEKFSCIAEICRHSCCVGWEIDIDDKTFEKYKKITGSFGERLNKNIVSDGENHIFCLDENERCPFLNDKNLCDIIINLGEENLCQICDDHPRFRNFFTDRTEMGLGLCCEAVGELLLSKQSKTKFVNLCDDGENENFSNEEKEFLKFREELFKIAQDREKSICERMEILLKTAKKDIHIKTFSEWIDFYLKLENLDEKWFEILKKNKNAKELQVDTEKFEIAFEQLLVYFLYRHLLDGIDDGNLNERVAFCVLSVWMIKNIVSFQLSENKEADIVELCRLYSSEIEYSDENAHLLIGLFA